MNARLCKNAAAVFATRLPGELVGAGECEWNVLEWKRFQGPGLAALTSSYHQGSVTTAPRALQPSTSFGLESIAVF